jgi:hypothetical protein
MFVRIVTNCKKYNKVSLDCKQSSSSSETYTTATTYTANDGRTAALQQR